ncbi:MAG: hypothetical protein WCJ84_05875 [Candidatus Peregrinibacteria bacterium]
MEKRRVFQEIESLNNNRTPEECKTGEIKKCEKDTHEGLNGLMGKVGLPSYNNEDTLPKGKEAIWNQSDFIQAEIIPRMEKALRGIATINYDKKTNSLRYTPPKRKEFELLEAQVEKAFEKAIYQVNSLPVKTGVSVENLKTIILESLQNSE